MAYQRHSPGARALHNGLYRRRAAVKRALRLHRARAETEASAGHRVAQAVVIGPGGRASLQPVEPAPSPSEYTAIKTGLGLSTSAVDPTQTEDEMTAVFGGETGQIALIQTQSPEEDSRFPSPSPQLAAETTSSAIVRVATTHATPRPIVTPNSQPIFTPEVVSLVVAPVSASLPPLLSGNTPSGGTRSSAATSTDPSSSFSLADPTSTGVDAASVAPPLSQNPPIIVGILMVVLLCLAAVAAFVSWITRSSRRRRKNKLEGIIIGGPDVEDPMADSHSFQEKDAEAGVGQFEPPRADTVQPTRPFYIEPHSGIFTHETYPSDAELHDSLRSPDGAYLPSLPVTKYALHDPPRKEHHLAGDALSRPQVQPPSRSRVQHGLARQKQQPSLSPEYPTHLGNSQRMGTQEEAVFNDEVPPSRLKDPPATSEPIGARPPNPTKLSWATALRSNLVSALDVVKQAASDRMLPGSSANRPTEQPSNPPDDRFTPLALRPARKSHGLLPPRRGTQEGDELTFGGISASRQLRTADSKDHKRDESGDNEEPAALHMSTIKDNYPRHAAAAAAAAIGGLGRFSFEQRMNNQRSQMQSQSGVFKKEGRHRLAVHSTALSRRRSGMASGSGSSSHSTTGSELDATMRKRRIGAV